MKTKSFSIALSGDAKTDFDAITAALSDLKIFALQMLVIDNHIMIFASVA